MPQADASNSLLAVFAHPDDESVSCGGLLARCASEGVHTSVLCLTRGGLGQVDDPARIEMGERRTRELLAAVDLLGVSDTIVLDYRNGFLPWTDRGILEAEIRDHIVRLRPAVVVTFDNDGLYWHPDHVVLHEVTTAAVQGLESPPALYYVSIPRGAMRAAWTAATAAAERAGEPPLAALALGVEVDAYGLFAATPTQKLDVRAQAVCKLRAIRSHASQLNGDVLDRLPEESASVLGVELYRRAAIGEPRPTFLDGWSEPLLETPPVDARSES